jgi:hypothetical protein
MDRHLETGDMSITGHATRHPPPKLKKLKAANAIDRPNTIWMSRRKPPTVSPPYFDFQL